MHNSSFVSHLEGAIDGAALTPRIVHTTHKHRPILVRYDLDAVNLALNPRMLRDRPQTMWRYRELLPIDDDDAIVSLGETVTPLIHCPCLGARLGAPNLYIKDESRLPTGSFKSRGMAVAVSMAKQLGLTALAAPSAGNAGGALAAYAARANIPCFLFMPALTPAVNRAEALLHGANVFLVDGLINDCGRLVRDAADALGWFDMSTLKEPYRIEGKKTMGLELAEQLHWNLPDAILYPTGGGTGLIAMAKAFNELERLRWLTSPTRPRFYACQSSTCKPIVNAFLNGDRFAKPPDNPHTIAAGLCVPSAIGDFLILDAIRQSRGKALAAQESRIPEWMALASRTEGLSLCPESAVCVGALQLALASGDIRPDDRIVIFNTAAAQKYIETIPADIPVIDHNAPLDWPSLVNKST